QPGIDGAAGRIDVDADVLVRVLGLQMQQLRHDQIGDVIGNRRAKENDPLAEQARVNVKRPLPAGGLLDDHWDQRAHGGDSIEGVSGVDYARRGRGLAALHSNLSLRALWARCSGCWSAT